MVAKSGMAARAVVRELVDRYEHDRTSSGGVKKSLKYVRKLLELLSWDTGHFGDLTEHGGVLAKEYALISVAGEERRPPQYSLRIDGMRKCFVGVLSPDIELREERVSALQLRRFAWSAGLPASFIANFRELSLYDGRVRPEREDGAGIARVVHVDYTRYEDRWDEIEALLSKKAIETGSWEHALGNAEEAAQSPSVDRAFLDDISEWRRLLAKSISAKNPTISIEALSAAVQSVIDRIIFLRICEDRGIEPYGQLRVLQRSNNVNKELDALFARADARYNAGLFRARPEKMVSAIGDDETLKRILSRLYYPESPYEFSVIGADIMGQIYESFLGQVLARSPQGEITLEWKPERRKSSGVYYTPAHVTNYVVRGTVAKLCEGRSPDEVSQLRVLDPACGSGSFLLAAYQYLLDWHHSRYVADSSRQKKDALQRIHRGYQLTIEERARILRNNIFGVDIDAQAVEITKLSLLLKVLEGAGAKQRQQFVLVPSYQLPNLDGNIQVGNSLVKRDFHQADGLSGGDAHTFAPFDYPSAFPEVFARHPPGFDAVIGNPPYISYAGRQAVHLPKHVRAYFKDMYEGFEWPSAHVLFMERSVKDLSRRYVSFIVPDQVGHLSDYARLRDVVTRSGGLFEVVYWGEKVFKGVVTPALTFIFDKAFRGPTRVVDEQGAARTSVFDGDIRWVISAHQDILDKIRARSFSIRDLVKSCGIQTTQAEEQVIPIEESTEHDIPALEGKSINRYICRTPAIALRGLVVRGEEKFREAVFLIRQTGKHPIVAPHEDHTVYFRNSLHGLYAPPGGWPNVLYLVGVLNSRLMKFVYRESTKEAGQKAFPQVKLGALGALPIRDLRKDVPEERAFHDEIVREVQEIIELNRAALRVSEPRERESILWRVRELDDRLDRLVDRLYGLSREEIGIIRDKLGESPVIRSPRPELSEMNPDELWACIDLGSVDESWEEALAELVEREDPDVAGYVARELQRDDLSIRARRALVFAAERAQSFEPEIREQLRKGLLAQALVMRDEGEEQPLWAAIRRLASLDPNQASDLLLFLREEDTIPTKQAALQSIQNIFLVTSPEPHDGTRALLEHVHRLAAKLISPDSVSHPGAPSAALQAFCAATALLDPDLESLAEKLVSLNRPHLSRHAADFIRSMRSRGHESATLQRALEALARSGTEATS